MGKVVEVDFIRKCRVSRGAGTKPARPKTAAPGAGKIYQLKIRLAGSDPEIWRRILVSGDVSLGKLHMLLQVAMGWFDFHLHEFIIDDVIYAEPDPESMVDSKDERRARLRRVAPFEGFSFMYLYDFGDGWDHLIEVEKILERHDVYKGFPVCIGGELASPPEDSGGMHGYYEKLEILKDPADPDHNDIKRWMGRGFNPDKFDPKTVNRLLKKLV